MSINQNASVINGSGAANRPGGRVSGGGGFNPLTTRAERAALLANGNEYACGAVDQLTTNTAIRVRLSAEIVDNIRSGVDYSTGAAISSELASDCRIVSGVAKNLADVAVLSQVERATSSASKETRKKAYSKALRDESKCFGGADERRRASQASTVAKGAAVFEALGLSAAEHGTAATYIEKYLSSWARLNSDTGIYVVGVPERNEDFTIVSTPNGKLYRSLTELDCSCVRKAIERSTGPRGVNQQLFADELRTLGYVKHKAEKIEGAELSDADIDAALLGEDVAPVSLELLAASFKRLLDSGNVTAGEAREFLRINELMFNLAFADSVPAEQSADDVASDVVDDAAALAAQ